MITTPTHPWLATINNQYRSSTALSVARCSARQGAAWKPLNAYRVARSRASTAVDTQMWLDLTPATPWGLRGACNGCAASDATPKAAQSRRLPRPCSSRRLGLAGRLRLRVAIEHEELVGGDAQGFADFAQHAQRGFDFRALISDVPNLIHIGRNGECPRAPIASCFAERPQPARKHGSLWWCVPFCRPVDFRAQRHLRSMMRLESTSQFVASILILPQQTSWS